MFSNTRTIGWFSNKNFSVRKYFVLLYCIVLIVLFPVTSYYFFEKTNQFRDHQLQHAITARTQDLERKAEYITRLISFNSSQSISEYNFSFLQNIVTEAVTGDEDLIGCQILGMSQEFTTLGHIGSNESFLIPLIKESWDWSGNRLIFKQQNDDLAPIPVVKLVLSRGENSPSNLLHFVTPVYVGDALWGTVNTIFSMTNLKESIGNIESDWNNQMRKYKISLYTFGCISVILGIFAAFLITRPILKAIYRLRDGVDLISRGDLSHHIDIGGIRITEFISLSNSFNLMTESLQLSRKKLAEYSQSLEEKVEERTKELKETQAELLNRAHETGMAEMAIGVLHNIGNAITPAKVSAILLQKEIESSPLRTELDAPLSASLEIITSSSDIAPEIKKQLQTVITLLPDGIREEYNNSINGLRSIIEKHNYIEEIIHLQMHYAKLRITPERVDVNIVINDSLKMMDDLIKKNNILVETKLNQVPAVLISETNLLQILINLIKNSCEAMVGSDISPRLLKISTKQSQSESGVVELSVVDTGCGFTPEMKESLFSFGYSTKRKSSGFGLHSCANYLIANNGSIEASSAGTGKGAQFTIRLQVAPCQEKLHDKG